LGDVGWRAAPVLLGLPVEVDRDLKAPKPWATWVLTGVTVLLSMAAFPNMQEMADRFGFIPSQAWRYGGLTLVTPFFLHAGWMHLIGNMYFLLLFGRRVETFLGRWRYLLLVLVATIAASLLHFCMQPQSTIPGIGASGGIAGIIAFYALKFPRVRIGMTIRLRWVTMPAWVALVMWLAYQGLLAEMQMLGIGAVNAFAHLGGALAGILAWVLWRKLKRENDGERSATGSGERLEATES
jgi:membrane associated rhomboid family serine protease